MNKRMARMFKMGDSIIDKMNAEYDRELLKVFSAKLKDVQKELATFIGKLDNVTLEEARKYNRLVKFEAELTDQLRDLGPSVKQITRKAIQENFKNAYYITGWATEGGINIDLGFGGLSQDVIRAALINPMDAIGWPGRTDANIKTLINRTRQAVTEGLVQGYGYKKTASLFKDKMGKSAFDAQRIIHTESHRAKTVGFNVGYDQSQESAERVGVSIQKIWDATLDAKTRPDHQTLDQKPADEDGFWSIGNAKAEGPGLFGLPEQDINCRCSTRVEVDGMSPEFRKDNETKELIPMGKYEEWQKNL